MTVYYRPPTAPDGSKMTFAQRQAARRAADIEHRAAQKQEPPTRDPIFELPFADRQRLRRAEAQGRREGEQRAAVEERAKRQAEFDALPDHEKRPPNKWRQLIELRQKDVGRKDVARRIKVYEREAKIEDERIDAIMEERRKRHELESAPEYAKAIAHWESASANAESEEERQEWARLKGLIEGGGAMDYWGQVSPIIQARLERVQAAVVEQAGRQAPMATEAKELAEKQKATEELQVTPDESSEPKKETPKQEQTE